MVSEIWSALKDMPTGTASFLGALAGSGLGLIAILIGALFNAHLNRRRDDRLRRTEARSISAALSAEFNSILDTINQNNEQIRSGNGLDFVVPDLSHSVRVAPHALDKIVLLDMETIKEVIECYIIIEQYCENLLMLGAKLDSQSVPNRRMIYVPGAKGDALIQMHQSIAERLNRAIYKVSKYLQ